MTVIKSWTNFEQALAQLEHFLSYAIDDDRDRAGVIQAFEFSFEQAWKAVQKHCAHEGIDVKSPREAFEQVLKLGLVAWNLEPGLRSMIDDRNLTSHTYKRSTAEEVLGRIQSKHLSLLRSILTGLQQRNDRNIA